MEVKAGFKQTEVGVIPDDWDVFEFGEIVSYTKGFAFKSMDYRSDGIRIIRVSDTTYTSIKDDTAVYIDTKKSSEFAKWKLRENDLIISTVGSKPPMWNSLVGKVIRIDEKYAGSLLNQNAVLVRARDNRSSVQFILLNNLRTERYIRHIQDIFRGNANQASITLEELFKFQIALPKRRAEQEAIAEALSDTDALIEALEQLLAKKRQVKQGAINKLFVPKDNWSKKSIGEVTIRHGKTNRLSSSGKFEGKYPFFTNSTTEVEKFTDEFDFDCEAIIGNTGGAAYFDYFHGKFSATADCLIFETREHTQFIYFLLKSKENYFNEIAFSGSGIKHLDKKLFSKTEITLPPLKEQTAIAEILSDMDAEITALEAKLSKARAVKAGMMSVLLSGSVRLV